MDRPAFKRPRALDSDCWHCGLDDLLGAHNGRDGHLFIPRSAIYGPYVDPAANDYWSADAVTARNAARLLPFDGYDFPAWDASMAFPPDPDDAWKVL